MKNWRESCVDSSMSIRETLDVINRSALKIALVVDQHFKLLGTVTDGDVRRAVLDNVSMENPVSKVMNSSPVTATSKSNRKQLTALMDKHVLMSIPIVSKSNQVEGLVSLHELVNKPSRPNAVLLMAGGMGKRLSPLTNDCPKPLLKVGERPLLEISLRNFVDAGFKRFYISTHYMPEKIQQYFADGSRWGVEITYVHEETPLGTAGAIGLLPKEDIVEDLLVMNGDILTNIDFDKLLSFHEESRPYATMCVREYVNQIPYGVIETDGYRITTIKEKPSYQHFVNAGIYVISPKLIDRVAKNTAVDMTTLLENCIAKDGDVAVYPILDYWLDIGRLDDFQQAQIDIKAL